MRLQLFHHAKKHPFFIVLTRVIPRVATQEADLFLVLSRHNSLTPLTRSSMHQPESYLKEL